MTKNIQSVMPLNSIEEVAKIFYDKNISSLLVLEDGKPVGIITEHDLMAGTLVFGHKKDTSIKKIMTSSVVFVESDASIIEAANLMIEKQIHKLPVLKDGKLVGLISATDLVVIFSMNKEDNIVKILGPQLGV